MLLKRHSLLSVGGIGFQIQGPCLKIILDHL